MPKSLASRITCLSLSFAFIAVAASTVVAQGRWTTETRLPKSLQEVSVVGFNGQVYVFGGSIHKVTTNSAWSYDPATRVWTSRAPYPGLARDHMGVAAVGDFIYLIGGTTRWPQPSVITVQKYNPSTNTWSAAAPLPGERAATGVAVMNGRIYVAGGSRAAVSVSDFTVYDPATDTWAVLPPMPTARDHLTAAAVGGKIYAVGGRVNPQSCSPMNTVEVYDPVSNAWSTAAPMLTEHAGHATGSVGGRIQVFGGEGSFADCRTNPTSEEYDPATNTWTALPKMPTPRHGIGGATIGNNVFIPGGATWTGDAATAAHERYDRLGTPTSGPVPSPWTDADIGAVGLAGTSVYDNGVFTIQGAGPNIWNSADAFHFIYQPMAGDGQIVARVETMGDTDLNAKAGVMIRETLSPGSRHVMLAAEPEDTLELVTRATTGGTAVKLTNGAIAQPVWLKIVRTGATITTFASPDGGAWSSMGTTTLALPATALVGLVVSSHSATKLTAATIDHVTVSAASGNIRPAVTMTAPADGATFTAPATINLAANASDSDGRITRVDFLANNTVIGSVTSAPFTASWSNVPAGTYTLAAIATDDDGAQTTSTAVSVTVNAPPASGTLPPPWQNADVGAVGVAGSASEASGRFTVRGAGADIWNAADAFQFVYQPLSGDGQIVARVASVQNVNVWTKAGVMVRDTLAANSAYAIMLVSAAKGLQFQSRTAAGATATGVAGAVAGAPYWVKAVRSGTTVTGFQSVDGVTWVQVGSATIALGSTAFVGLAVTSHNATAAATAAFDGVAVTPAGGPGAVPAPWTDADVGTVGKAGSATWQAGTFTIDAAGANVWSTADSFNFVNQALSGDIEVVARVRSLQNTDLHAKAGVMLRASLAANSPHIILDVEPGGRIEFMTRASTGAVTTVIANSTRAFPAWLKLARTGATVTASTSADGAAWTPVGTTTTSLPATLFTGLAVTSHNTAVLTRAVIDSVSAKATPSQGGGGTISFTRKTIVVNGTSAAPPAIAVAGFSGPTSLTFGPDGRLYVSVLNGKIYALTLDPAKLTTPGGIAVTDVQVFDDIYLKPSIVCDANGANCQAQPAPGAGRQVTGIAIDPASTPGNVILYVTHSGLQKGKTDMTLYTFGGALSRLTLRPDAANPSRMVVVDDQDLLVGLPRSREAHTVNAMAFGPDGWMYISIGGNTNSGAPSTFFANLPEVYLSAAVVRFNYKNLLGTALPLDFTNVRKASDMTPYAGKFEIYSTGYRNSYDLLWHSNGRLYVNDNSPNLSQGNTPGSADGCSTPSIDVNTQPDTLHIATKGSYGGHPNPARGECIWGDGKPYNPDLLPDARFRAPIGKYPASAPSANGLAEFRSDAFNGAMKGDLISANYAGDQTLRRVVLTADGSGVASITKLAQFANPLDVVVDGNGVIYVLEYGSSALTLLVPTEMGSCPVAGSDPKLTDSDKDGYTDFDERANGADACSAASTPADFDRNGVSDLLDNDDDGDGIADGADQLFLDPQNGAATPVPFAIEWDPSDGAYGGVEHSGFPGTQISSGAPVDQASGHGLDPAAIHPGDAGGHMTLWTSAGTAEGATNTQMNALQVGFDSATDFRVWSRITQPFTGLTPAPGHVGGVFFGPSQDNYVRLALIGVAGGGTAIQLASEVGGVFKEIARVIVTGPISNLDVFLVGRPGTGTVTAFYDVNTTGTMKAIGTAIAVPAGWFGNNAGAAANTSLAGLMVSHGAAQQMAFVYDFFRIDRTVP